MKTCFKPTRGVKFSPVSSALSRTQGRKCSKSSQILAQMTRTGGYKNSAGLRRPRLRCYPYTVVCKSPTSDAQRGVKICASLVGGVRRGRARHGVGVAESKISREILQMIATSEREERGTKALKISHNPRYVWCFLCQMMTPHCTAMTP